MKKWQQEEKGQNRNQSLLSDDELDEGVFEQDSMFDPHSGEQDEVEVTGEGIQKKFGSKELWRKSNENLYNLKHANKFGEA